MTEELQTSSTLDGKYEILEKLHEGGMGAVYKVRHRLLGETRVVKTLNARLSDDKESRIRLQREAQTAIQLRHPNIVQVYDFTIDAGGCAYIVMEFLDGFTLRALLDAQGSQPLHLVLELADQALGALAFLHEQGFVHRDISPDNLMLVRGVQGQPDLKLLDFGVVKGQSETQMTAGGVFLGKFYYASPEHFTDGASELSAGSDLYSFGIMLYELVTGHRAIPGETMTELMHGHVTQPPTPFDEYDPQGRVPDELRAAILRSLAKEPSDRFGSAADFLEALRPLKARYPLALKRWQSSFAQLSAKISTPSLTTGSTQQHLNAQFGLEPTPAARVLDSQDNPETEERVDGITQPIAQDLSAQPDANSTPPGLPSPIPSELERTRRLPARELESLARSEGQEGLNQSGPGDPSADSLELEPQLDTAPEQPQANTSASRLQTLFQSARARLSSWQHQRLRPWYQKLQGGVLRVWNNHLRGLMRRVGDGFGRCTEALRRLSLRWGSMSPKRQYWLAGALIATGALLVLALAVLVPDHAPPPLEITQPPASETEDLPPQPLKPAVREELLAARKAVDELDLELAAQLLEQLEKDGEPMHPEEEVLWAQLLLDLESASEAESIQQQIEVLPLQLREALTTGQARKISQLVEAIDEARAQAPAIDAGIEDDLARARQIKTHYHAMWSAVKNSDTRAQLSSSLALLRLLPNCRDAVRLRDKAAVAFLDRAAVEHRDGDIDEALATLRQLEKIYPDQPDVLPRIQELESYRTAVQSQRELLERARRLGAEQPEVALELVAGIEPLAELEDEFASLIRHLRRPMPSPDRSPPVIALLSSNYAYGEAFEARFLIEDASPIASADVWIQFGRRGSFQKFSLQKAGPDQYRLKVAPHIHGNVRWIHLYVRAIDQAGNLGSFQEPSSPHRVRRGQ